MKKIQLRTFILLAVILLGCIYRLMVIKFAPPLFVSLSPVGALALFGGCYFSNRFQSLLFPLGILFVSDLVMMKVLFAEYSSGVLYQGWEWVYASFLLTVVLGFLIKKISVLRIISFSAIAALLHWVISDFGIWLFGLNILTGEPFTKDWSGFLQCYVLALPFLFKMFLGNFVFGLILFGAFELAQTKWGILKKSSRRMHA